MMIRGKELALSALAVGAAAAVGYALRSSQQADRAARSKADLGARIVDHDEIPAEATIVDGTSRRLREIPGARRAIDRAVRNNAHDEWEHVTIEHDGAWSVVDSIRGSLPYHDGDRTEYNGVYVHSGDRIVVLDAIGWARLEEPIQ